MVHAAEQQRLARVSEPVFAIRTAHRCDELAVTSFLRRDEAANLFVLAWLDRHGLAPNGGGATYTFYLAQTHRRHEILGVCLLVAERMALPVGPATAGRGFGTCLRRMGIELDHVVGARAPVRALWSTYGARRTPRLDRPQCFMVLEPPHLTPRAASPVRLAVPADLDALVPVARAMYREEALVDPCIAEPEAFRRLQQQRVERGQTYVWIESGQLIFKADISSFTTRVGAQIAGVYTLPARRGHHVASRGLRDICGRLLTQVPRVTLYVNEDNAAARRVYTRLGFRDHVDWHSIFIR